MTTDCTARQLELQGFGRRTLVAAFDGGQISSDGGLPLLRAVEGRRRIIGRFAECFEDHRDARLIEHGVEELVAQRVYALAAGYEDLNDHDELRRDPLLASVVGKADPTGSDRRQAQDRGNPLAGKSTLHRLEWGLQGEAGEDRYRRIAVNPEAVDRFFVELFVDGHRRPPRQITLDLDATDDLIHGTQEGRFFHGYYHGYCYLPLYIFCELPPAVRSAAAVRHRRLGGECRGAGAHCRPDPGALAEGEDPGARRLGVCPRGADELVRAATRGLRLRAGAQQAARRRPGAGFRAGRAALRRVRAARAGLRRVLLPHAAELEPLATGDRQGRDHPATDPTPALSSPRSRAIRRPIYERIYCARGDMENRIKEQQLCLFADRTSAHLMRVNQVRLWLSSVAYLLLDELRRCGWPAPSWRARSATRSASN